MKPSKEILTLTRKIVEDRWKEKKARHSDNLVKIDRRVKELDRKINGFMERLFETSDKAMIKHYEAHVKKLSSKRGLLSAQATQTYNLDTSLEGAVGTVFDFIENPFSL